MTAVYILILSGAFWDTLMEPILSQQSKQASHA